MFCPFCGSQNVPDASLCSNCGYSFSSNKGAPTPPVSPDWEEHGHLFNIVSFLITVRDVLFSPTATFRGLKRGNTLFNAFLFGLIGATIGGAANTFWQFLVSIMGFAPEGGALYRWFGTTSTFIVTLFMVPFISAISILLMSAVLHFLLTLFGGAKKGFPATFKVFAYAEGATALLGVIPFCGSVAGLVWLLVICIIGLKEAHETTHGKTLAAVLLPLLLCCVCAAFAAFILVLSGVSLARFNHFFPWQ
jgi:hypothetical protein